MHAIVLLSFTLPLLALSGDKETKHPPSDDAQKAQETQDNVQEAISWGEPRNSIRLGLSPARLQWSDKEPSIEVVIWYETVGKEPRTVPKHHLKYDANIAHVMFKGTCNDKPLELIYLVPRRATQSPKDVLLKPGQRFHETFVIHSGENRQVIRGLQFWGLPAVPPGESLTLQARWLPGEEFLTDEARQSKKVVESGTITITRIDGGRTPEK